MERRFATYNETLKCVETFLKKTCIKSFCVEICMGSCCAGCWENSKNACHKHEGVRLACSCFLCSVLSSHLTTSAHLVDTEKGNINATEYVNQMHSCLRRIRGVIETLVRINGPGGNIYFDPITEQNRNAFRVDRTVLKDLKSTTKAIGNLMVDFMANPRNYFSIESMVRSRNARRERNKRNEIKKSFQDRIVKEKKRKDH